MTSRTRDVKECRELLRKGSQSFYAASLLLPKEVRAAATALYAFCRLADDAVDLGADPEQALTELLDRLDRAYGGMPYSSAPDRAFARVVAEYEIPRQLPEALLEGFAWDAAGRRYEDLSALYSYAARVAGSVGAMMTLVMGRRSATTVARACDLGVAMQLTNIARDIGEDARAGRLYLPLEWMYEANIDPEHWLSRPAFTPTIGLLVQRLLKHADDLYQQATAGIGQLPLSCRPAIHAARMIYSEIGREVEKHRLDSVSRRAVVPIARKLNRLTVALMATLSKPADCQDPALPETEFLVRSVKPLDGNKQRQTIRAPAFDNQLAWLVDLFGRLERDQRAANTRIRQRPVRQVTVRHGRTRRPVPFTPQTT